MSVKSRRFLLVGYDPVDLEERRERWRLEGIDCATAADIDLARFWMTHGHFDLVIIDLDLHNSAPQDISGYLLAKKTPAKQRKILQFTRSDNLNALFDSGASLSSTNVDGILGYKYKKWTPEYVNSIKGYMAPKETDWKLKINDSRLSLEELAAKLPGFPQELPDGISREEINRCRCEELEELLRTIIKGKTTLHIVEDMWHHGERLCVKLEANAGSRKECRYAAMLTSPQAAQRDHDQDEIIRRLTGSSRQHTVYCGYDETSHFGVYLHELTGARGEIFSLTDHWRHERREIVAKSLRALQELFGDINPVGPKAVRESYFHRYHPTWQEDSRRLAPAFDHLVDIIANHIEQFGHRFERSAERIFLHLEGDELLQFGYPPDYARRLDQAYFAPKVVASPGELHGDTILVREDAELYLTDFSKAHDETPLADTAAELEALIRFDLPLPARVSFAEHARLASRLRFEGGFESLPVGLPDAADDLDEILAGPASQVDFCLDQIRSCRSWAAEIGLKPEHLPPALFMNTARRIIDLGWDSESGPLAAEIPLGYGLLLALLSLTPLHEVAESQSELQDRITRVTRGVYRYKGEEFTLVVQRSNVFDLLLDRENQIVLIDDLLEVLYSDRNHVKDRVTKLSRTKNLNQIIPRIKKDLGDYTHIEGDWWIWTHRGAGYSFHNPPEPPMQKRKAK